MKKQELVWYASYGSNMLYAGLMRYLQGCKCEYNNKEYPHVSDEDIRQQPFETVPIIIPCALYFAKESPSWQSKGVAFIDWLKPGLTIGRMYLITEDQLDAIQKGEGESWYGQKCCLGKYNGYPIYTFTNKDNSQTEVAPSEKYLRMIKDGLIETMKDESEVYFCEFVKPYFDAK